MKSYKTKVSPRKENSGGKAARGPEKADKTPRADHFSNSPPPNGARADKPARTNRSGSKSRKHFAQYKNNIQQQAPQIP